MRASEAVAWGKLAVAALLLAALAAAWRYTPLSEFLSPASIGAWAKALREQRWAAVALVLLYTPAEFVMFPRAVLTMLGAIAFGPWLGFAYAFIGIFFASLATYFAGRLLPRGSVQRFAGARVERMTKVVRRHGVLAVLAVRLVPVAPSGMEGIIAGAIRIPLWHYLVGTMAGMTPGMLATTFFGHQISNALEDPSRVNYWLIGIVVVLLAGLICVLTRRFALE